MAKKKKVNKQKVDVCKTKTGSCSGGCCAYFLGFLGAAIYFIANSTGFWNGVLGVLKALVWPAFLVYELMKFIGI
tara:strand:+ start:99 stop:323 length:225 start_codon:yes stop_codon:yes gene_type:complete